MRKLLTTVFLASLAPAVVVAEQASDTPPVVVVTQVQPKVAHALPANTEVTLSMNEDLTTKGGRLAVGSKFYLSVVDDVRYGEYVVVPRGARGVGEVTWLTGKGGFGKSGKMEIELRHVEVGSNRIPLNGQYRQEGEGNTVATIGAVVAVGVLGGFVTGKSAMIPRGRELVAYTRDATPLALPE